MTLDSSFSLASTPAADESDRPFEPWQSVSNSDSSNGSEKLIFGDENNLLRALITESTELSIQEFFPLCIFGPAGTGKSELAKWIVKRHFPDCRTTQLTATDFYREFIEAIDLDNVAGFRQSYLTGDRVTILDNFNELVSRSGALDQLEQLLDRSCNLIITCTENPAELTGVPARLVSRLLSGLSIPLSHPSTEIRQLILAQEVSRLGANITEDATRWMAENVVSTIPEIKQSVAGMRIQIDFSKPISLSIVQNTFSTYGTQKPALALIARLVAKNQKIKVSELVGQSRKRSLVQARGIAVFIAREFFGYKFEEIGRHFGNRDHSTIMHAHRKFSLESSSDTGLANSVDEITLAIRKSFG